MKFLYEYRTSDNVKHSGVIKAASKDAAFAALKAQGMRPSRVSEAPGFFNKLLGKGKRWIAIVALSVGLGYFVLSAIGVLPGLPGGAAFREGDVQDWEERGQLYGDPAVIKLASRNNWESTFDNVGDRWLANHAIPGKKCGCDRPGDWWREVAVSLVSGRVNRVSIAADDLAEVAKIKRMVNGLKNELNRYLDAGGKVEGYMRRLDKRQAEEAKIYKRVKTELSRCTDTKVWHEKNHELRILGLPMVDSEGEQ